MRGIYILVEGPTEEEFIDKVLRPHFNAHAIYDVRAILMQTSPGFKGGDIKYIRYKSNAERLLKSENDILITSLIDFFRLKNDFPDYQSAIDIIDKNAQVTFLENAIIKDISHNRFTPYIQLHEFEGLLFSDVKAFNIIPDLTSNQKQQLQKIITGYPNPELINDKPETSPSNRLKNIIPKYKKTLHGPYIAEEIGIARMLQQCPRFASWVNNLILKVKVA